MVLPMSGATARRAVVAYEVPDEDESWELEEEDMPESAWHDAIIELLKLVLKAWARRVAVDAMVTSNLALRWNAERWKVGVDPDVALYVPPPPEGEDTSSVCTWERGHDPPRVACEVVSKGTAAKDYVKGPEQYAASGTVELWVFDPRRYGPRSRGGPFRLQVWRRDDSGTFRQIYRGDGPFFSPEMSAWLVLTDRRTRLRLADDPEGTRLWPTPEEAAEREFARAESERARAESERVSAEEGVRLERERVLRLEAELTAMRAELERLRSKA
jgi:Uma2 family endonuclease